MRVKTEQYEESRAALERERMLMEKRNQEIEVENLDVYGFFLLLLTILGASQADED